MVEEQGVDAFLMPLRHLRHSRPRFHHCFLRTASRDIDTWSSLGPKPKTSKLLMLSHVKPVYDVRMRLTK